MKSSLLSSSIAEPYAQALMSLAQSRNLAQDFGQACRELIEALGGSEDLRSLITSPVVKDEDKKAVLRQILGEQSNPYLLNFLMLLVDKRRIVFLEAICQQYLALLRQMTNTVLAEVTASRELSEEQRQAVVNKVKALTGAASVELQSSIDPDLIGGVIIRVGSQVFDASLRGQLRRISLNLGNAA